MSRGESIYYGLRAAWAAFASIYEFCRGLGPEARAALEKIDVQVTLEFE